LIKEDAVPEKTDKALKFIEDFKESMDDDFNTAKVVASFYSLFRFLNDSMQKKKTRPSANEAKGYIEVILEVGNVLGVLLEEPEKIIEEIKSYQLSRKGLNREDIEELIFKRNDARKEKDYKKADELRDKLLEMGVVIKDTPTGTIWSFS
jgi:cysteinyl-tRNA synthetase